MCWVRSEDSDGVARRQLVDSGLVRIWIATFTFGIGIEGGVETIVSFGDILLQMLAYAGMS
jgi:hypothetical protein